MDVFLEHDPDTWTTIPLSFPNGPFRNSASWARSVGEAFGTGRRERKILRERADALTLVSSRPGLLARLWYRPGTAWPLIAQVSAFPRDVLPATMTADEVARASGPDAMNDVTSERLEVSGTPAVRARGNLHDDEGRVQRCIRIGFGNPEWWVLVESYSYDSAAMTDEFAGALTALADGVRFR